LDPVGGRTRHTDSAGYTRPVPVMLGLRLRLAPAWLRRRHPALLTAIVTAGLVVGLYLLAGHPAHQDKPPCHQVSHRTVCP